MWAALKLEEDSTFRQPCMFPLLEGEVQAGLHACADGCGGTRRSANDDRFQGDGGVALRPAAATTNSIGTAADGLPR
eukprot:COSAG02_NODE_1015_length_15191_cov_6.937450_5_plen_77_part_00